VRRIRNADIKQCGGRSVRIFHRERLEGKSDWEVPLSDVQRETMMPRVEIDPERGAPHWRLEWGHVGKPCPWCGVYTQHWHDDDGFHEGAMPRQGPPRVSGKFFKGLFNSFMLQMALIILVILFLFAFGSFFR
jgi:hypothetical protein